MLKISKATIKDILNPKNDFIWQHGEVIKLPMELIEINNFNFNEMSVDEFNLLAENINDAGMIEPIIVVPIIPKEKNKPYKFRIVGGEHRFEAMRLDDAEIINAVITDPKIMTEKEQMKQCARLNKIHGSANKEKFKSFVEKIITEHNVSFDEAAHELGFVDKDEFQNMLEDARESLPNIAAKKEFDRVREEIKTVDDLTLVLNSLFTKFGSSIPYNYMILDFGGKNHIWIRLKDKKDYKLVLDKAEEAQSKKVTFDSVLRNLLIKTNFSEFIKNNKKDLEEPKEECFESLVGDNL